MRRSRSSNCRNYPTCPRRREAMDATTSLVVTVLDAPSVPRRDGRTCGGPPPVRCFIPPTSLRPHKRSRRCNSLPRRRQKENGERRDILGPTNAAFGDACQKRRFGACVRGHVLRHVRPDDPGRNRIHAYAMRMFGYPIPTWPEAIDARLRILPPFARRTIPRATACATRN